MTLVQIHQDLYGIDYNAEPDTIMETYEKYKAIIDDTQPQTKEEIFAKTKLTSDYACILADKQQYSKALPYLKTAIGLWETNDGLWEKPLIKIRTYEQLHFLLGVSYYRLKQLKLSKKEFEWLTKSYPDNDVFHNWLVATKRQQLYYVSAAFAAIGLVSWLPYFLTGENPTSDLGRLVFRICVVGYILTYVFASFVYDPKKKRR